MKCCIDGCDRPGVISADHPGASIYCIKHGACGYCGELVWDFQPVYIGGRDVYICDCVSASRSEPPQPVCVPEPLPVKSNIIKFGDYTPKKRSASR